MVAGPGLEPGVILLMRQAKLPLLAPRSEWRKAQDLHL